jgi:hypothetical protein
VTSKKTVVILFSMETSIRKLLEEVIQLPEDQRLIFANRVLAVNDSANKAEVKSAWDSEICARIAKYDSGELSSRSLSDVFF